MVEFFNFNQMIQKINRIKLLICMKSFLFSWMKSFESLEFVYNYRQYRLYFLWDSNLNFIYDLVLLYHRHLLLIFHGRAYNLYLVFFFFTILTSRINIYYCQGQELLFYLD